MEIRRKFDCSCCGLCCRNLDKNQNKIYNDFIKDYDEL